MTKNLDDSKYGEEWRTKLVMLIEFFQVKLKGIKGKENDNKLDLLIQLT